MQLKNHFAECYQWQINFNVFHPCTLRDIILTLITQNSTELERNHIGSCAILEQD